MPVTSAHMTLPVLISLPEELVDGLERRFGAPLPVGAIDTALGTEADWQELVDSDRIHPVRPGEILPPLGERIRCDCCVPRFCRNVLRWRGRTRCACTPERLKSA